MSLRFRLSVLMTLIFGLVFLAATGWVMHDAKRAVAQETRAAPRLAVQLLEIAFARGGRDPLERRREILERIGDFAKIRHLDIELRQGEKRSAVSAEAAGASQAGAPPWFARFVTPSTTEVRHVIQVAGMPRTEVIVRPDAKDEIAEAWSEARSTLILLSLFFVVASVLMFVTIGLGLRPINVILLGLDGIRKGDYQRRLPPIKLPELGAIAEHFNHMAQALESSREEAHTLARRSLEIQEAERRRLAHELHDEMGQSVSAIKAVAVAINRNSSDPAIKKQAQTIGEISTRVYDGVRRMTRRLRPAALDELGLIPALTSMVQDWNEASDPVCRLHLSGELSGLPEDVEIGVYRIVQECLTNVSKHAMASEVTVALDREVRTDGRLCLRVADNGCGFDPASVVPSLGLRGIRERVETLNGRFELQSQPGAGVRLKVELPVSAPVGGI